MHTRMDAAVTVDAQTASTATWKTAQPAVSHSAHTHHRFYPEEAPRDHRPTHRKSDSPRARDFPPALSLHRALRGASTENATVTLFSVSSSLTPFLRL